MIPAMNKSADHLAAKLKREGGVAGNWEDPKNVEYVEYIFNLGVPWLRLEEDFADFRSQSRI